MGIQARSHQRANLASWLTCLCIVAAMAGCGYVLATAVNPPIDQARSTEVTFYMRSEIARLRALPTTSLADTRLLTEANAQLVGVEVRGDVLTIVTNIDNASATPYSGAMLCVVGVGYLDKVHDLHHYAIVGTQGKLPSTPGLGCSVLAGHPGEFE